MVPFVFYGRNKVLGMNLFIGSIHGFLGKLIVIMQPSAGGQITDLCMC